MGQQGEGHSQGDPAAAAAGVAGGGPGHSRGWSSPTAPTVSGSSGSATSLQSSGWDNGAPQPMHPPWRQGQMRQGGGRATLQGAVVVRLADPDGFLVSNDIISDVFAALSSLK